MKKARALIMGAGVGIYDEEAGQIVGGVPTRGEYARKVREEAAVLGYELTNVVWYDERPFNTGPGYMVEL